MPVGYYVRVVVGLVGDAAASPSSLHLSLFLSFFLSYEQSSVFRVTEES